MKKIVTALLIAQAGLSVAGALPDLGPAPELVGAQWFNTPQPISLANLRGKVVVVHFWTLGCINCKHNLPSYNAWSREFKGTPFELVGIHTPETDYERSPAHVKEAIASRDIHYPVLIDNSSINWDRWHQQFWPAIYLIDKHGRIRDTWSGELEYDHAGGTAKLTREIKELLAER